MKKLSKPAKQMPEETIGIGLVEAGARSETCFVITKTCRRS